MQHISFAISPYRQFKQLLLTQMEEGILVPGQKIPGERELARRYGLCRVTVAKALSELADEGFLVRRPVKGTFVAEQLSLASQFRRDTSASRVIGVSFLDVYQVTHPYFAKLCKAVAQRCLEKDLAMEVHTFRRSDIYFRRDNPIVNAIFKRRVRGLLLAGRVALEDIFAIMTSRIPFVWINNEIPSQDIPSVLVDYTHGAYVGVEYLIQLGHCRIGLILGSPHNRASYLSISGYELALRTGGIGFDQTLLRGGRFDEESGYTSMAGFLALSPRPTAVYVVDEVLACGVLKALAEKRIRVPEELSVVACGNLISPFATTPSLTTMDIHLEQVGQAAVDMLEEVSAGEVKGLHNVVFKPTLVVRGSTGPISI